MRNAPAGNGEPSREKVGSEVLVDQKRRKSAPGSPDSGYELVRHFSSNPDSLWNLELQYCYTIAAASSSTALALAICPRPQEWDSENLIATLSGGSRLCHVLP